MPSYSFATFGAFVFDGNGGAGITGDITVRAPLRTVQTLSNALAKEPGQGADFLSDYGTISFHVRLTGRNTISEAAPEHVRRMWANLQTEVAKDSNTLTISPAGFSVPYTYRIFKNDPLTQVLTGFTQTRSVIEVDVSLRYLP